MRRSSRSAANSAMKRAKERAVTKKPKGFWSAIGNGRHRFAGYTRTFERSLLIQVILIGVGIASFVVLIKTYNAFQEDREFRQEERKNWRLDRIDRAWNRVLRRATGNTAKGKALSYLFSQNVSLNGTDLSCKNMGGWGIAKCDKPVIISDFEVNGVIHNEINSLNTILYTLLKKTNIIFNLDNSEIESPKISNSTITISLDAAAVQNAVFVNSKIFILNEHLTIFSGSSFVNTILGSTSNIKIANSNISNAYFFGAIASGNPSLTRNWLWAKTPPKCLYGKGTNSFGNTDIDEQGKIVGYNDYGKKSEYTICNFLDEKTISICDILTEQQKNSLKIFQQSKSKNIEPELTPSMPSPCAYAPAKEVFGRSYAETPQELTLEQAKFLYPEIYK